MGDGREEVLGKGWARKLMKEYFEMCEMGLIRMGEQRQAVVHRKKPVYRTRVKYLMNMRVEHLENNDNQTDKQIIKQLWAMCCLCVEGCNEVV